MWLLWRGLEIINDGFIFALAMNDIKTTNHQVSPPTPRKQPTINL
jgi:hypothetical protein